MLLHLSVILITGGSATHTPPGQTPLGRHPQTPWADTPTPADTSSRHPLGRHPPGQTPSPRQIPPSGQTPPWANTPPVQCMLGYGQKAGGTHPTGMQSCLTYDCIRQVKEIRFHLSTLL